MAIVSKFCSHTLMCKYSTEIVCVCEYWSCVYVWYCV